MKQLYSFITGLLLFTSSSLFGQLVVNDNVTATDLANQIVGSGVTVSNVQLRCGNEGYGTFSNGNTTNVGLTNGILLTTGHADDAKGPNNEGNTTVNQGSSFNGDADLDPLTPFSIEDVCSLSFDFVANSDYITVQYVFGSEEYNEYVCSSFNDLFAFFVSGPNPLGGNYANQNVALVPFSTLPVSINTINNGQPGQFGDAENCQSLSNQAYYINNNNGTTIGYDGFTVVLTAQIAIIPGETYSFKFAIADISDSNLDSGVFIKANSFSVFLCQAGTINFLPTSVATPYCINDGVADIVKVTSNSVTPGENFNYLLVNEAGTIIALNETGEFNMSSYGEGEFNIYAISYSGVVSGVGVGQQLSAIAANSLEGCFELSNALQVEGINCTDLPIIECPENLNLTCLSEVPAPNAQLVELISQQCTGDVTFAFENQTYEGTPCNKTITRLYSAEDYCGNVGYCYQTIQVVDNIAPVAVNTPATEIWVSCDEEVPALAVDFIENCGGEVTITNFSNEVPVNSCETVIYRTIYGTDACGNFSGFSQIVHIIDESAPVIEFVPESLVITCDQDVPAAVEPIFSDNCDQELTITPASSIVQLSCGYQIVRSWTATDNCGNQITAEQIITVNDNIAPEFAAFPPYVHLNCEEFESFAGPTATDNCSDVTITFTDALSSGGCYGVIVRTWVATDACGNSTSAIQYISRIDNNAPVIENPENMTVECDNAPTAIPSINIYDDCGFPVDVLEASQTINVIDECTYEIIWHWVAMDYCENVSEATTVVTVTDTTAPTFEASENQTFSCEEEFTAPLAPIFSDNCDQELIIEGSQIIIEGNCANNYQIQYSWTATDNCGNASTATIVYTIVDNTAPVFSTQNIAQFTYECSTEIPVVTPVVTDNCSNFTLDYNDSVLWSEGCSSGFQRIWTATDECGNYATFTQYINIVDTTAPVITGALEINLPCDDYQGVYASVTDNCDTDIEISHSDELVSGGCQGRVIRTYTASDDCGNSAELVQIITLIDEVMPSVSFATASQTFECGTTPDAPVVIFTDNCDEELELASSVNTSGDCTEVVTYTFSATDNCGNKNTVEVVYTFVDTTAPVVYAPNGGQFSCDQDIVFGEASAEDLCSEVVSILFEDEEIAGECQGERTVIRTWFATDACGNIGYATSTYYVFDNSAPIFESIDETTTIECSSLIPSTNYVVTDNCSNVSVHVDEAIEDGECAGEYSIIRTFTATDDCGNSAQATHTIHVVDTTAPIIEGNLEVEASCEIVNEGTTSYTGNMISATDNCSEVTITYNDEIVSGGCQGRVIRNYTAVDACGNIATFQQIITLVDEENPTIAEMPVNQIIECGTEVPTFSPIFSDNCDDELELTAISSIAIDGCTEIISRSWTATDNCGNALTVSQTITIVDTTAPVWNNESTEVTYNCDESYVVIAPTAIDLCHSTEVNFTYERIDGECESEYTEVYTYVATDECGNASAPLTYTIHVVDNNAPEFTFLPEGGVIVCSEFNGFEEATATDACGNVTVTFTEETLPYNVEGENEDCGQLRTQTIGGWGTSAPNNPNANNPAVYRNANFPGAFPNGISIGCEDNLYVFTSSLAVQNFLPAGGQSSILEGTTINPTGVQNQLASQLLAATLSVGFDNYDPNFGASSASLGNAIYNSGTFEGFTVNEVIAIANDILGGCSSAYSLQTVADALESLNSNYVDGTQDGGAFSCGSESVCGTEITRTYLATDECGNSTSAVVSYILIDDVAPLISAEEVIELPCTADQETIATYYAIAEDACSNVSLTYTDINGTANCAGSIIRTYTATDDCGNTSTFVQSIIFVDDVAPSVEAYQEELIIECGLEIPAFEPVFSDNCDAELTINAISSIAIDGCEEIISRSVTATDNCGNSTTASQIVRIVDTTSPEWVSESIEVEIECGTAINFVAPTAEDNCSQAGISSEMVTIAGDCEGEYTEVITFIATDACGNTSEPLTYTIHYVDNSAPEFTFVPSNESLNCGADLPSVLATAEDFCSSAEVTFTDMIIEGNCPSNYTIARSFVAVDDCGNASDAVTVYYTFSDSDAPTFTTSLEDVTFECAQEIVPVAVEATDNCSSIEITSSIATISSDDCGNGTYEVVYVAVDACGNAATTSYTVTFNDTTAPTLEGVPADVVIACDAEIPAAATVTAFDNCTELVNVSMTETIVGDMPAEGSIADCNLLTPARPAGNPCNYPYDWAMALFNMPSQHRYYQVAEGNLVRYPDGSAHVTAVLTNAVNSANGFNVDVWFSGEMDWSSWSTQSFPTSFKADCGGEDENHPEWLYFILQNGEGAELTGFGDYAGSALNLSHAPSNNYFGFQLGDGANNYNGADNGFGGWFTYSGTFIVNSATNVQNTMVTGAGDFAFELDCCPDYQIVRCWTAFDCSGNEVSACQTISFEGSTGNDNNNEVMPEEPKQIANDNALVLGVFPNPAVENAVFTFTSPVKGKMLLEIYDLAGAKVVEVFNSTVIADTEYRIDVNVQNLARGVYMYRLTNGVDSEIGRLIISK